MGKYTTISIPTPLFQEVEKTIKRHAWAGYTSPTAFITQATVKEVERLSKQETRRIPIDPKTWAVLSAQAAKENTTPDALAYRIGMEMIKKYAKGSE